MAPLKGFTLGEKHQHYNALLKETKAKELGDLPKINYDDDDIDNLMRIDIACHNKNVDYIFEVLKCSDMLYVSRAIKHSLWLITEPEFKHLINAHYLDSNVFPDMMPKAIAKLLLHIRLNLKDVERAEAFYNYESSYRKGTIAFKWLENCSLEFIETIVEQHAVNIPRGIIARLCRKSVNILSVYLNNHTARCDIPLNDFMFLLKSDTDEFLNIAHSFSSSKISITFDAKATQTLMKRCFQRVIENFSWFHGRIDITILVKYILINKVDIESFLLSNYARDWLSFGNLKYFLIKIQPDRIITFLKKLFGISTSADTNAKGLSDDKESKSDDKGIDQIIDAKNTNVTIVTPKNKNRPNRSELEELFYKIQQFTRYYEESRCVYCWYEFAPFDNAFQDLQNLIYAESSPEERHSMLIVLLRSARKNMEHVKRVLQYYRERHINEPYIHKIKFVNSMLKLHDTFRFEDDVWNILTDLFYSLDVYVQSNNKVEECIKAIVIYNIINKQPIPEIIEEKLAFDTFKNLKSKLSPTEQETLFEYLYNHCMIKLQSLDMQRETGMSMTVRLIEDIWNFLIDWGKEAKHHQMVIDYIIKINLVKQELQFKNDIRHLYYQVKPYHKLLFEYSLLLHPCQEMCINALKHNPGLLVQYEKEVTSLCYDKNMSIRKLMKKLRIYWHESFATDYRKKFLDGIKKIEGHHLVKGIVILTPQRLLLDFMNLYAPSYNKIRRVRESIDTYVSLQKQIAKSLYLARPQLPVEVVMCYAKGNVLHSTQISLNSIYSNLKSKDIDKHIHILLNAPVLLKKQGVRLACINMKTEELLDIFPSVWKSTRNSSIRTMIFVASFNFLDKAGDNLAKDTWKLLSFMLDELNGKANKKICETLTKLQVVPSSIINELYQKCFLFLRDMPEKIGCNRSVSSLISVLEYAADIIQKLDSDFVENNILSVPVYDIYFVPDSSGKNRALSKVLSAYLTCSRDESTQMEKYKSLMKPLFTKCVPEWKNNRFQANIIAIFQDFLTSTAQYLLQLVPSKDIVMPVQMLGCMKKELVSALIDEEMYDLITQWKLYTAYINILNEMKIEKPDEFNSWDKIRYKSIHEFAKVCVEYLKEDIENHFPSIYMVFSGAMQKTLKYFLIEKDNFWRLLDGMLKYDNVEIYMLVLHITVENDDWESAKYRIKEKIRVCPSIEVRTHYYNSFSKQYYYRADEDSESDENETSESEGSESDCEDEQIEGDESGGEEVEEEESEEEESNGEKCEGDESDGQEPLDVSPEDATKLTYRWKCSLV